MTDARFADGAESALRLRAETAEDVPVLSALVQDAVLTGDALAYDRRGRRLGLRLNRFRWEDAPRAEARRRGYERVQSLLLVRDVLRLETQGVRPDPTQVLSLLAVSWVPGEDGAGVIELTFAGDGALRAHVECLDIALKDLTRPYLAPSGKAPQHS